jgi:hypothetical protein
MFRPLLLPALLALLACSTAPAPAPAPAATPAPSPAEPAQPGPTHPAGATPALGSHADEAPTAEATVDARGKIMQFHLASYGEPPLGTILVEGDGADARYARAQVRITRETKVYQSRGGKRIPYNHLHVDDVVEVTFEGPVAESDPVQAVAAEIVLVRAP